MTDPHDIDELASAHLDGTTSASEAALVAADPAVLARVEELRAVRAAVGALPPADPDRRDAAIAAALAAFADEDGTHSEGDGAPVARVTSLATVAARRGPSARTIRLIGAAAAAVLVAALVPLVSRLDGSDDSADTAASAAKTEESGRAANESSAGLAEDSSVAESAPAAGASAATSTTTSARPTDLGPFDDLSALVADIEAQQVKDGSNAPTSYSVLAHDDSCLSRRGDEATAAGASAVGAATATVADEPVVVLIVTEPGGARSLRVFESDSCEPLVERDL